ncbi:glutamine synthetase [Penicillium brasilianum]|uniref:Mediator of RNA polymerase II transcription subunit 1 n=1 Tax=Penicillium brasilianum TaxID=104259 RepID=A0A1S9RP12_PENBI|nr:glutamine synthetase [Penicillium brasilianum]
MATPSAKPGATPTHLTTSPHPSAPLRSIAHKSPSTRTPSASGPGHAPHISVSSHQYATPLAVTSAVDDPVVFSSPSALLALGGYTGISPLPVAHESLVGPSMNENDIQTLGMQGIKLGGVPRDSEEEQKHRIQEVVQCLRARVAGRGVSREGIERLSRLEGFESIWQDNDINIAGNFVDLEIEFYPGYDVVKNVSLRYATPEFTEGERRDEASAVLKRNLVQPLEDVEHGRWRCLQGFHENLHWLAKLDKLSQEVNCFEALEGLEENLNRVWAEEGKRGKYDGEYEHLCNGVIGRPSMHKGSRIGLGLEYWVEQAKVLDAKRQKISPDAMVVDQDQNNELDGQQKLWTVMIECEEGYPSLRISKEWVGNEIFTTGQNSESAPSGGPTETVNWLEPPQTMRLSHGDHDPMALDSSMLESTPPNRRFVAKLDPPLELPILAASEIYRHLGMQLPQEFKMVTYDNLLISEGSQLDVTPQPSRRKRRMSVQGFDSTGAACTNHHNYTFQAFESVAGRTIRDLPFSHPRQLADILPVFRQYALLANLIRKITGGSTKSKDGKREPSKGASVGDSASASQKLSFAGQSDIITLSNDDPNEEKLSALLGDGFSAAFTTVTSSFHSEEDPDDVRVDVTLRTQIGQSPALMLLVTDSSTNAEEAVVKPVQLSICAEVGLNGRITVVDVAELTGQSGDSGDAEMQGTDAAGPKLQEMHEKIARVLEISQDLGILVEWVLRWLRQRPGSG